ncbi:MAG: YciI family protein [Candidatus Velamenicoccus archaeovorus]
MKYALLIYADESVWESMGGEGRARMYEEHGRFAAWLEEKGWIRGAEELGSTKSATTVRIREGELLTTDGPFAETKEQLGGFYLIGCENLDQAIEAASRLPGVDRGTIEIRPVVELPDADHPH